VSKHITARTTSTLYRDNGTDVLTVSILVSGTVSDTDEVAKGISSERIVVGGFSQGGALALAAGLQFSQKLAGIVAMSSWLPLSRSYPDKLGRHAKEVPVLMCSGDVDNVVNPMFSSQSSKALSDIGVSVEFKSYPGLAHSANPVELRDVCEFLQRTLSSSR
jgi:predicted esterase